MFSYLERTGIESHNVSFGSYDYITFTDKYNTSGMIDHYTFDSDESYQLMSEKPNLLRFLNNMRDKVLNSNATFSASVELLKDDLDHNNKFYICYSAKFIDGSEYLTHFGDSNRKNSLYDDILGDLIEADENDELIVDEYTV